MKAQNENERPANYWMIRFDDNQQTTVEAPDGFDQALELFKDTNPESVIYSVSHMSYVSTEWKDTNPE